MDQVLGLHSLVPRKENAIPIGARCCHKLNFEFWHKVSFENLWSLRLFGENISSNWANFCKSWQIKIAFTSQFLAFIVNFIPSGLLQGPSSFYQKYWAHRPNLQ
jgi:hypothetical protein